MNNLNNFDGIQDKYLQAYNRSMIALNLHHRGDVALSEDYLAQFSDADKMSIGLLIMDIGERGIQQVVKDMRNKVVFEDDGALEEALA